MGVPVSNFLLEVLFVSTPTSTSFFFRFFFLSFFPSNIQGVVRYERCYDRVLNHHCLHFHPRGDKKANQKYRWAGLL